MWKFATAMNRIQNTQSNAQNKLIIVVLVIDRDVVVHFARIKITMNSARWCGLEFGVYATQFRHFGHSKNSTQSLLMSRFMSVYVFRNVSENNWIQRQAERTFHHAAYLIRRSTPVSALCLLLYSAVFGLFGCFSLLSVIEFDFSRRN